MKYSCALPWPPTVNNYYTVVRGRKILSKKGRQFKSDCSFYIDRLPEPMKGKLEVVIQVCMPDKRRRDIDNLLKPILDVLGQYGVYEDDSQIIDLRIKSIGGKKGTVCINIMEIDA